MRFRKVLVFIVILSIAVGLCACKSRTSGQAGESEDAGESVEVSEIPEIEEAESELPPPVSQPAPEKDYAVQETADAFLKSAKTGDRAAIQSYADYETLFKLQGGENPDWILQQILMRMKYEILLAEAEGDNARVSVKFTNVDMNRIIPLYFQESMTLEFENALSDTPKDTEQMEKEYRRIFAALISKHGETRVEKTADVELVQEDDIWKIKPSSSLGNAMLGGYIDARDNFAGEARAMAESQAAALQQPEEDPDFSAGDFGDGVSMVAPRE